MTGKTYPATPLIRLPEEIEHALYLIREELKSRKLFDGFHRAGMEDCCFQPNLDSLILEKMGLNDGTDATFSAYNAIMDKRSKKICADPSANMKQVLKAYIALVNEKKARSEKQK